MTKEARRIKFDEFAADLPRLLEDIARDNKPLLVEKHGRVFRVETAAQELPIEATATYDPLRVRQMLRDTAGAFKGLDRKKFLTEMHADREQGSRGRPA